MPRLALPLLLLLALTCLNGCAAYGVYDDPRLAGTMSADTELAAKIKTALMDESFTGGWSVAVYSFYNHVFLVGEVPADMQAKALTIARRYKPHSVTPHWFTAKTHDESDMALATKLRTELIGTKGLSSTRVETEVNAGRVVLLGVVKDNAERQLAIRAARGVSGVTSVTSYLMLPQKAGQLGDIQPQHAEGADQPAANASPAPAPASAESGPESRDLP